MAEDNFKTLAWNEECPNQMGKFLAEKIKICNQIDILTGYFFFNGFDAIQKALIENKNVKLRILVGMHAGVDVSGLITELYKTEKTDTNYPEEYRKQLREVLRSWPQNQITPVQAEAWDLYAQMIEDRRLEIKKTTFDNHSKIYIFHGTDGKISYTGGSSNFSQAGLLSRNEFNIFETQDADRVSELFDSLWENAVPVAVKDLKEARETSEITKTLKEKTPDSAVEPFDAYMKVLYEYMRLQEPDEKLDSRIRKIMREAQFPDGGKIEQQEYQIDAIHLAQKILNTHGGVIIADVVGLGKSITASVLASLSDAPGIIIAPSALCGEGNWATYLSTFHLDQDGWLCCSYGMIDTIPQETVTKAKTIILDEAHNIRNRNTEAYQSLKKLCSNDKKIVFLSATPFNNKPDDIYSMISLIPQNTIAGSSKTDLEGIFKGFSKQFEDIKKESDIQKRKKAAANLSEKIKNIVSKITIRRNRLDLTDKKSPYYEKMKEKISEFAPPCNEEFTLSPDVSEFYKKILTEYFAGKNKKFQGYMYKPELSNGGRSDTEGQLFSMICHFIVTRWESSPSAFKKTVQNIKKSLDASIKLFESEGVFLRFSSDFTEDDWDSDEDFSASFEKEWEKAVCKYKHTIYVNSKERKQEIEKLLQKKNKKNTVTVLSKPESFLDGLQGDSKVLQNILKDFNSKEMDLENPEKDAKFQCLVKKIRDVLDGKLDKGKPDEGKIRKMIVFSGFADTAEYVAENLQKHFPDSVMFVSGKSIKDELRDALSFGFLKEEIEEKKSKNVHFTMRDAILRNFKYTALPKDEVAKKKWRILVCTDVLSEGIDLNAAGIVFNYDMAYNPVRIIQRLGRINRIANKVFEMLYRVNFFPTPTGEGVNNVKKLSTLKMDFIQELFAEDASILTEDESVKKAGAAYKIGETDSAEGLMSEDLQIRGMYEAALKQKCGTDKDEQEKYLDKIKNFSGRFCKFCGTEETLLFFFRDAVSVSAIELPRFVSQKDADTVSILLIKALEKIACEPDRKSIPFKCSEKDPVWNAYSTWRQKNFYISSVKPNIKKYLKAYEIIKDMDLGSEKEKIMRILMKNPDFADNVIKTKTPGTDVVLRLFQTYKQPEHQNDRQCIMSIGVLLN